MSLPNHNKTDNPAYAELVTHLQLAVAQSKLSLKDAGESVASLTTTFIEMAQDMQELKDLVNQEGSANSDELKSKILSLCDQFVARTMEATVGFQFYDKMTQRQNHMNETLNELVDLIQTHGASGTPEHWQAIHDSVHRRYTMEQDKRLMECIMSGMGPDEAVAEASKPVETDIELF